MQFPPHEVLPATSRRFFSRAVRKAFSKGTKDGSNKSTRHSHPTAQRLEGVSPQTLRTPTVQLSRPRFDQAVFFLFCDPFRTRRVCSDADASDGVACNRHVPKPKTRIQDPQDPPTKQNLKIQDLQVPRQNRLVWV